MGEISRPNEILYEEGPARNKKSEGIFLLFVVETDTMPGFARGSVFRGMASRLGSLSIVLRS